MATLKESFAWNPGMTTCFHLKTLKVNLYKFAYFLRYLLLLYSLALHEMKRFDCSLQCGRNFEKSKLNIFL